MPPSAGTKLGPYEILAPLGAGGMGEVWKARDTRLNRIVAIKTSKTGFSERFEREARAVAALSHPNICHLYDVAEAPEGFGYLVMEYIEGQVLKGPLPLDQALRFSSQICDALDAAHAKGITHRDLKPANILVTRSAGVKLLDFGLAKIETPVVIGKDTVTMGLAEAVTGKGEILGTLLYMSPEQVNGKDVDERSDIFSFGVVLYELLTGKHAFEGATPASVIAAILDRPAPSVADVAPPALDRLLKRCLEKDPENRWQSARDLRAELEWIASTPQETAAPNRPVARPASRIIPWTVAGLLAVGLGFVGYRHATEEVPRMLKVSLLPPENTVAEDAIGPAPAVSPDGKSIAFVAAVDGKNEIWIRDFNSLTARPLTGIDNSGFLFWSPDGRSIGFFSGGKVKKIAVTGGPALTLADTISFAGASWGKDYIIFGTDNGIVRMSPSGGDLTPITTVAPGREIVDAGPWFLPDGRHFLYGAVGAPNQPSAIYSGDAESKDPAKNRRPAMVAATQAEYSQGFILFLRDRTLMAQRFDLGSLEAHGDAAPVAEQVDSLFSVDGMYSVSQNGVLAYLSGASGNTRFSWYDRAGKTAGAIGTPGAGFSAAISPNGSTVAFDRIQPDLGGDVWLLDLARGSESRFTFGSGFKGYPVWSPDGSRIAFFSLGDGASGAVYLKARGGGPEQPLHKPLPGIRSPCDWSRDGKYIVECVNDPKTKLDIWVAPLSTNQEPFVYVNSEFIEKSAKISPDSKWLAYASDETGRTEVYLQTFPKPGGKVPVSTNGGDLPLWSRDGKELYYVAGDHKLMALEVNGIGGTIQLGTAKALFPVSLGSASSSGFLYDVAKDGRFLIPAPVESADSHAITVVVNWTAGLPK